MKTLRSMALIMLTLFTFSCSNEEATTPNEETQAIPKLISTKKLTDQSLLKQVAETYNSTKKVSLRTAEGGLHELQFAFDDATISEYMGTEIQSIAAYEVNYNPNQTTYYSYGTYVDNGVVMDEGLVMKTQVVNANHYIVDYYDTNYNEYIGQVTVVGGEIISATTTSYSFGSRFGKCVSKTINTFVDGSWQGAGTGLLCMAFGPECALAIGVVCSYWAF